MRTLENSGIKTKTAQRQKTTLSLQTSKCFEILIHKGPQIHESFVWESVSQLMNSDGVHDVPSFILSHNNFQNGTGKFYVVNEDIFYAVIFPSSLTSYTLVDFFEQFGTHINKKSKINICYEISLTILDEPSFVVPSEMRLVDIFGESLRRMKLSCCGKEMSLDGCQNRYAVEFSNTDLVFIPDASDEETFFYFGHNKIIIKKSEACNKQLIRSKILPFTKYKGHEALTICVIEETTGTLLPRANNLIKFKNLFIDNPTQTTQGIQKGDRVAIVDLIDCYGDANNQIKVYHFSPDRSFINYFRVPYDLTVKEHLIKNGIWDQFEDNIKHSLEHRFHDTTNLYYLAYSDSNYSSLWNSSPQNTNHVLLTQKFSSFPTDNILLYSTLSSPSDIHHLYQLFKDKKPTPHSTLYNHILGELYNTVKCQTMFKGLKLKTPSLWDNNIKQEIWYFWNVFHTDINAIEMIHDVLIKLINEWEGTGELYETIYLMVLGKPQFQRIEQLLKTKVEKWSLYLMIKPPEPLESDRKRKRGEKPGPKQQRVIFNVPHDATLDQILICSGLFKPHHYLDRKQMIRFTLGSTKGDVLSHNETIPKTIKTSINRPLELFWKKYTSYTTSGASFSQEPIDVLDALSHKINSDTESIDSVDYFYKITKLGQSSNNSSFFR